jgi:flagellar protein FliS
MDSIKIKDFQNRIVNANKKELLLINYELIFLAIDEGVAAIDKKDMAEFERHILRARQLLRELTDTLDFKFDISKALISLYIFVNGQLIKGTVSHKKEPVLVAKKILNNLYQGWQEIKDDGNEPIIENGQKVYAGLTYGKGQLNETVELNAQSRGYQV